MKFVWILFLILVFSCHGITTGDDCFPPPCSQKALVKDLSGLDGCGLVLELTDGTILIPERRVYIQPPKMEDDPLYYFNLQAGEEVLISYKDSPGMVSACMAGKIVFVTCIQKSAFFNN